VNKMKKGIEGKKIFHIVIEGHGEDQMREFFEEVQNKFSLYDNCAFEECEPEDTIIDRDRWEETGSIMIDKELVKKFSKE